MNMPLLSDNMPPAVHRRYIKARQELEDVKQTVIAEMTADDTITPEEAERRVETFIHAMARRRAYQPGPLLR